MDTTNLPDGFYLALDEKPSDLHTILVLADWYDDQANTTASSCLRWLSRRSLFPYKYRKSDSRLNVHGPSWNDDWVWWCHEGQTQDGWGYPRTCRLPRDLWVLLPHHFAYPPSVFKEYPTRRQAYEALFSAWAMLSPQNPFAIQQRPQ